MKDRATLIGGVAGLAVAIAAMPPMLAAIRDLGAARIERAAIAAALAAAADAADAAPPARARGDAASALRAAATIVRDSGSAGGVLVEAARPEAAASPGVAVLAVTASGSEKAVLAFADGIERGDPRLRWRRWRLAALPGGAVRIQGQVIVPWR